MLVDELLLELDSDADESELELELELDTEAVMVLSARTDARIESHNRTNCHSIIFNVESSMN